MKPFPIKWVLSRVFYMFLTQCFKKKLITSLCVAVFYLKFFEHPSFGQVAHEIYPSEWKVHSSEILITIMYCWYMFLMAVATDFTHVTINLVCCCLSPVLISHKRSCWKISQSLKPIWLDVEMLVPLFFKNQSVLQRYLSNFRAIGTLEEA